MIGAVYVYPDCKTKFKVKEIRRCIVVFECGHWCTDNVFKDLLLWQGVQTSIF